MIAAWRVSSFNKTNLTMNKPQIFTWASTPLRSILQEIKLCMPWLIVRQHRWDNAKDSRHDGDHFQSASCGVAYAARNPGRDVNVVNKCRKRESTILSNRHCNSTFLCTHKQTINPVLGHIVCPAGEPAQCVSDCSGPLELPRAL